VLHTVFAFVNTFCMKKEIIWEGIEYHSLEYAVLVTSSGSHLISSSIVGIYKGKKYRVDYIIKTNSRWQVKYLELQSMVNNKSRKYLLASDSRAQWTLDGEKTQRFAGCTEVDISLTPFTNSLPVNRLKMRKKESQIIDVVFVDVLEGKIKRVKQQYTKLSDRSYKFQNVPNDFEAILTTDRTGFVRNYPGLFKMTNK
jgi:uncharacterized protein